MKTKNLLSAFLCILLLLPISCNNQPTDIPVIDMDNPSGSIDLKISDLLNDIAIVPLETNDDLVLSTAGMSYTVTDRYILVNTREKLLQFDRNGKYIKTLITKGNGPNEFNNIMYPMVDEKRDILYYADYKSQMVLISMDLKTGNLQEFTIPDMPSNNIRKIDAEGNLYGFPTSSVIRMSSSGSDGEAKASDSLSLAFCYHPVSQSTTIINGSHSFPTSNQQKTLFRQGDHVLFFFPAYSDTLYRINGALLLPECVVKLRKAQTEVMDGGVFLDFVFSSSSTILRKIESKIDVARDGAGEIQRISVMQELLVYLHLNKKGELQTIRSITIDPLSCTIDVDDYIKGRKERRQEEIPIQPLPSVSGLWAHYAVEAYNMIALIEDALKGNTLTSSQRKTLEEVAAQIDDDSNPVLIIGKIK